MVVLFKGQRVDGNSSGKNGLWGKIVGTITMVEHIRGAGVA